MAQLTVRSDRTWDQVRTALNALGLHVELNQRLDASIKLIKDENAAYDGFIGQLQAALARAAAPQVLAAYTQAAQDATFFHQQAATKATRWGLAQPPPLAIPAHTPQPVVAGHI